MDSPGVIARMRRTWSLGAFDPHSNAITPVRLLLALTVVVSHSVETGGFGAPPLTAETGGEANLGLIAVMGFFGLSGFLIASSRERTARLPFLRNRALRILPGYWMAILVTAFVIAPLASALQGIPLPTGGPGAYATAHLPFNLAGTDEGIQSVFG